MRDLFGLILLLVLIWLHYKNVANSEIRLYYFPALLLKLIAGISLGLVYSYCYEGGDTWNYFYQAQNFGEVAFSNWSNFIDLFVLSKYELIEKFDFTSQPRAALMVKLVAIVNLVTNNNYWVSSTYFSFFSFIGIWAFSSWVHKSFSYGKVAAISLFVWPSFVFWSSGILKESIAVGLIFWIMAKYFQMIESKLFKKAIPILIALYFLFVIKYYFAVVLLVVMLVYGIIEVTPINKKTFLQQTAAWFIIFAIGIIIGGFLHPNLQISNFLNVMFNNNQDFIAISKDKSLVHFVEAPTHWIWLLLNSPKALFAGLFLPLTLSNESLFYSISAIENWLLIILFLRGVLMLNFKNLNTRLNLLLASVFYVSMLAVFLSLSTPNLGTLSRYKVSYVPVILVLILVANRFKVPGKKA